MKDLDRRKLLSVSVDRQNVSWKFVELLQQEQAEPVAELIFHCSGGEDS